MNVSIQASAIESALPMPRDLQVGDIVRIRGTKDVGRVTDEYYSSYTICVFGETNRKEGFASGLLEMWTPAPRRQFKSGEVRIVSTGRVGYLSEDNGNEEEDQPYTVIVYDEGDGPDENFSASELIPWVPQAGDRVIELHSDGNNEVGIGTVLANDGTTSHVQWDTLTDAPYWPNIRLEPAPWGVAD
jgi:hypothetical protein